MTFQATVYRILIASPSDVIAERKAIPEIISSWNVINSVKMKAVLLPVMWETHSVPEMGDRPQAIINKQIVKGCDILIGAFWTRLGTDTGVEESGTVEEIKEFQKSGKPVMIYFSSVPVVPNSIDPKQYEKLVSFMDECRKQGLVERYDSILEFRDKLSRQISTKMWELHKIPGDEYAIDASETTKKESNDMLSDQFCDIIEGYKLDWTTEKTIEPVSIENGRQIVQDLTREILNFRVPISKIYGKDIIGNIDPVISKLKIVQTHQLYLDGGKSYNEFWKLGDEIFASLDSIVETIRKDIHIPKIDNNMEKILILLSQKENQGIKHMVTEAIAKEVGLSITESNHYLRELVKAKFVYDLLTMGMPTRYALDDDGRGYLIARGIK